MDGEWFGWAMNEWEDGISKWRADKVKSAFKKKHGRSLGSSRKSAHISRRHKMSARHSRSNKQRLHRVSPKMQKEWAKGVSQWVAQREVVRSNHYFLKKFGIIKGNSSEEWKEGMQKWMDQNLLNKSWKWRGAKSKPNPSKNRRRIKRLKRIANDTKKLRDDFLLSEINKQKQSRLLSADKETFSEEFQIYLFKNEKQFGPYSLDKIEIFLVNDQLKLDDLAFYEGCVNWIKVQQVPGLKFKRDTNCDKHLTPQKKQPKLQNPTIQETFGQSHESESKKNQGTPDSNISQRRIRSRGRDGRLLVWGSVLLFIFSLAFGIFYYFNLISKQSERITDLLEIHNIDMEKSGLYNQRKKIAPISGDFEKAIKTQLNDYLKFNSNTGHYDFIYDSDIKLENYPSVEQQRGGGGFSYQLIIALKKPINIPRNSMINAHFVPINVSFRTAGGSKNKQTNKRPLTATSVTELGSLPSVTHDWKGCVCCPFYSFAMEKNLGDSLTKNDYNEVRYLAMNSFLGGCNGRPSYFARLQSISITLPTKD